MSTTYSPEQRAKSLLKIHNGACSVKMDSVLAVEFQKMEAAGKVIIVKCSSAPIDCINVYSKEYAEDFLKRMGKPINYHA